MKTSKRTQGLPGMIALIISLGACSSTAPKSKQPNENDFPTLARVEYVLECMGQHGGQSYMSLYQCSCAIDRIATQMPYQEFDQAKTFSNLKRIPGEKGAAFRDSPQSKTLRDQLKQAHQVAEKACFGSS